MEEEKYFESLVERGKINRKKMKLFNSRIRAFNPNDFPDSKHIRDRNLVWNHYSKGTMACVCCGEAMIEALSLDHIKNDGAFHRSEMKGSIISWAIKNNFPPTLQVLCYNCNRAKYLNGGWCPHKDPFRNFNKK